MLYGTLLGGTNGEVNAQIALDGAGNIYARIGLPNGPWDVRAD